MKSSALPIVERGRIQLLRPSVAYATSRSARVACAAAIKTKNDAENRNRGYEVQIEGSHLGEKVQRTRGNIQSNDQPHSQVGVAEAPNNSK